MPYYNCYVFTANIIYIDISTEHMMMDSLKTKRKGEKVLTLKLLVVKLGSVSGLRAFGQILLQNGARVME